MRFLTFYGETTAEAVHEFAEKRGLLDKLPKQYKHPREDYLIASENPPVFVLADGVTLDFRKFVKNGIRYPNPSPALEVARIFCQAVVRSAQETYDLSADNAIKQVFTEANAEVAKYNKKLGKSEYAGNPTGYYAATGAFAIIKERRVYWARICDSFVAHFDKNMKLLHMTSGSCQPYAVINGEERMIEQVNFGAYELSESDRVCVFTDGFEGYMKNDSFLNILGIWDKSLEARVTNFEKEMNAKNPEVYGHERSLIVVLG